MSDRTLLESQSQRSARLEYARRMPLSWVSKRRTPLILAACILFISGAIYWFWTPLTHWIAWNYCIRQAAAHVMPGVASGHYNPQTYRNLYSVDSRLQLIGGESGHVIFIGTLKRPDGTPRLVIITGGRGNSERLLEGTRALVLPVPSLLKLAPPAPVLKPRQHEYGTVVIGWSPRTTQMRSGIIDPSNPSHVAIAFTVDPPFFSASQIAVAMGATTHPDEMPTDPAPAGGMIDAYLRDDDSIAFRLVSSYGPINPGFNQRSILPGDEASVRSQAANVARR